MNCYKVVRISQDGGYEIITYLVSNSISKIATYIESIIDIDKDSYLLSITLERSPPGSAKII